MKIITKNTKQDILKEKALLLIHQQGYKAMTMRNLADNIGCDVANLYNYIQSKQSLLSTLLMEISNMFLDGVSHIKESHCDFNTKVRQLVSLYIKLAYQYPYQVALLINEWRNLEAQSLNAFLSEKKQVEDCIHAIVKQGVKEGKVIKNNPKWTLEHILASLRWTFNLFTDSKQKPNPIDLENHIYALLINGISN